MYEIGAAERERILAEVQELRSVPVPSSQKAMGCPLMILAVAIAVIGPRFLGQFGYVAATLGGVLLIAGVWFFFAGAMGPLSFLLERTSKGIEALAERYDELTPQERQSAALNALLYAYHSDGPTTSMIYDADQQGERLGKALPYVEAVERVLLAENLIYPVFTEVGDSSADG